MKKIIFIMALLITNFVNAQEKSTFNLNLNSNEFVRIKDGVILTNLDSIKSNVNEIFRISDSDELIKLELPNKEKPYMIINSGFDNYSQYVNLVDEKFQKFQIPFVFNDKIITYAEGQKILDKKNSKLTYSSNKYIKDKKVPFGYFIIQ